MEISSLGNDQFHTEAIESSIPRVPPTTEPVCLELMLRNKRSHCNAQPTHCYKEYRCSLQLEEAPKQQQKPHTPSKINHFFYILILIISAKAFFSNKVTFTNFQGLGPTTSGDIFQPLQWFQHATELRNHLYTEPLPGPDTPALCSLLPLAFPARFVL